MSKITKHLLTDQEVRQSGLPCIVIDDTGTPGQATNSKYVCQSRKTWVAVLLSPSDFLTASTELPLALKKLAALCGGDEFHLTDIYSGTKSFKNVSPETRLGIISFLADIFSRNYYPILVQTLDETGAAKMRPILPNLPGSALDFKKHGDLALWMLLTRVQDRLNDPSSKVRTPFFAVIDQGERWKDGMAVDLRKTVSDSSAFTQSSIYSRDSKSFPVLQLADFAAFCINRQQWLLVSEKRSHFDMQFLKIISEANMNWVDGKKLNVSFDLWSPSDYDFLRGVSDEETGIPSR